jgi:glucoside 3-dehydrogenase (cytochrome c) hitch-hiker subunit
MHRREALHLIGAAALTPLLAPLSARERWALGRKLHRQLAAGETGRALSAPQLAQVRALADTILPTTDTPGALDVGAPEFVDLLLAEWYPDEERQQFLSGLDGLDARCRELQGKPLAELDPPGRAAFLTAIESTRGEPGSPEHAYSRIKQQLVFGFLTSKPIAALTRTTPIIPGRFDGCIPLRGAQ